MMRDREYEKFLDAIEQKLWEDAKAKLVLAPKALALARRRKTVSDKIAPLEKQREEIDEAARLLGVEVTRKGEVVARSNYRGRPEFHNTAMVQFQALRTALGLARLTKDQKRVQAIVSEISTLAQISTGE